MKNTWSIKGSLKVLDCAKAQEVEEEGRLDFPIILYKRSSCCLVEGHLSKIHVEPSVSTDGALTTSNWNSLLFLNCLLPLWLF